MKDFALNKKYAKIISDLAFFVVLQKKNIRNFFKRKYAIVQF